MDILNHNRKAWDRQVEDGKNPWTIPVSHEEIEAARRGEWRIVLTPTFPVPHHWLPDLPGKDVLCLASGGGQQGPVLAAAGARVTVFDNSPRQLDQDRLVAEREGLAITTVQGDMGDLSVFEDEVFDYIVHPVSNIFTPDVRRVWLEAYRVLRPGGSLVSGITNPFLYIFDVNEMEQGRLVVKHSLPYSDLESLSEEEKQRYIENGDPFEFSHTLEEQIGGQLEAGFLITGFYEDQPPPHDYDPLNRYLPVFFATLAVKPEFME